MLPFRNILFPVDYSPPCRMIVPYVKEMVRRFGTQLMLVHAYGPEALAFSELPITDPDLPEEAHAHERLRLHEFALEMFPGQHAECFTELGEAGAAIHKVVQHQGADLVMMASHGYGPVRRFLVGSVTAKVLHDLGSAVWTGIGSHMAEHPSRLPYQSILCAVDDGEEAEAVVRAAAEFAAVYQAKLSLVHVVETPPPTLEVDFTPYRKEVLESAHIKLRGIDGATEIGRAARSARRSRRGWGARRSGSQTSGSHRHRPRPCPGKFPAYLWSRLYPIVRESPCPVVSI